MPQELILATIKSGFDAATALFTWLQTPDGVQFAKQVRDDHTAMDKAVADAGAWVAKLLKGQLP